jgi:light-regulated signal transduction histidine kinase (bacteriophytochrome)
VPAAEPAPRAVPPGRAAAELRDFAHVVSHDLQAPLGRIDRYARLLAESLGERLGAIPRGHLEQLRRSAEQMQAMLDAILEYARVESRGGSFERVDLEAVLDQVREVLGSELEGSGAVLANEPLPTVEADRSQMVRLFQNLIANAVKFRGGEPPSIRVAAQENGDGWDLLVIDNGIGIPAADQERVFGMFERLHSESEIPGSGVGLAICKRIAERHGGSIRVESGPGRGSTFIVHLPHRS